MEPERENARRLEAEVRAFVEELQLAQSARRDMPSQIPLSHPEDQMYYPDDEPDKSFGEDDVAEQANGRSPYARTPQFVGAPANYQKSPLADEAPTVAPRKPQVARPAMREAPEAKGFGKLKALFGGKRSEPDATSRAFETKPLPAPSASPEERRAYLAAAAKAGYDIKPDDLQAFLGRVGATGEVGAIQDHLFVQRAGGEGALAELLMRQKPQLVDPARFAERAAYDAQEPFIRQYAKDFNVTNVLADRERFDAAMTRVGQLAPLAPNDGYDRFREVREALRDVGVRVTVKDFEQFKTEVKTEWTADLMREDGGKSLGTKMLLDMTLPPGSRQLVGSDARRWESVLNENQQFPELAARREEVRQLAQQSLPANGDVKTSYLPPASPAAPTIIRDGVQRPAPQGYSQEGKIVKIDEGAREVWQATRSTSGPDQKMEAVRYDLADITKAIPLDDLKTAMERGHNVSVGLKNGAFDVVDRDWVPRFELGDLEKAAKTLEGIPEREPEGVEFDR